MQFRRRRNTKRTGAAVLAGLGAGALLVTMVWRSRQNAAKKKRARGAPDEALAERVRGRIEESIGHAQPIGVSTRGGWVTLSGPVLASEAGPLVACVRSVRGVRGVENLLEIHAEEEAR